MRSTGVETLVTDHEVVTLAEDPLLLLKDAVRFRAFPDLSAYLPVRWFDAAAYTGNGGETSHDWPVLLERVADPLGLPVGCRTP